jgi:hypothetical protein
VESDPFINVSKTQQTITNPFTQVFAENLHFPIISSIAVAVAKRLELLEASAFAASASSFLSSEK